eukprot:610885-Heterocapsa_arctica.AAC.1
MKRNDIDFNCWFKNQYHMNVLQKQNISRQMYPQSFRTKLRTEQCWQSRVGTDHRQAYAIKEEKYPDTKWKYKKKQCVDHTAGIEVDTGGVTQESRQHKYKQSQQSRRYDTYHKAYTLTKVGENNPNSEDNITGSNNSSSRANIMEFDLMNK